MKISSVSVMPSILGRSVMQHPSDDSGSVPVSIGGTLTGFLRAPGEPGGTVGRVPLDRTLRRARMP